MRRQSHLTALLILVLVTAGCAGSPADGSTATASADGSTATPTGTPTATSPSTSVDFPDGPKAPPDRPSTLNESAVREYVRTYEYRYVYNSLWMNEYTEVTLDCRVDDVSRRERGYAAVVTCTGHSNTDVPENSTLTPGPHADWFTQSYRYLVTADATRRQRVENRDPV